MNMQTDLLTVLTEDRVQNNTHSPFSMLALMNMQYQAFLYLILQNIGRSRWKYFNMARIVIYKAWK